MSLIQAEGKKTALITHSTKQTLNSTGGTAPGALGASSTEGADELAAIRNPWDRARAARRTPQSNRPDSVEEILRFRGAVGGRETGLSSHTRPRQRRRLAPHQRGVEHRA